MATPDQKHDGFGFQHPDRIDLGAFAGGQAPDDEVEPPLQQLFAEKARGGDVNLGRDIGEREAGVAERRQHPVHRRARDRADADMALRARGNSRNLAFGVAKFDQHAGGAAGEAGPDFGQGDAATKAQVDVMADDPLDLGQQTRGGGLRDAKRLGSQTQLSGLLQGHQKLQMPQFEAAFQEGVSHGITFLL